MSSRAKAFLLAASAACALPVVASVPASADWVAGGCVSRSVLDPTDPGRETWLETTVSFFVGTLDVTSFSMTCWIQTDEDLVNGGIDSTEADPTNAASWGNPQPSGEVANTRHTCSGTGPANACLNPVVFNASETLYYQCTHVTWRDGGSPGAINPFSLVDHLLRDVFSTGGITTMGGANQVVATIVLAVNNLVATVTGTIDPEAHTRWLDAKPMNNSDASRRKDGIQCEIV